MCVCISRRRRHHRHEHECRCRRRDHAMETVWRKLVRRLQRVNREKAPRLQPFLSNFGGTHYNPFSRWARILLPLTFIPSMQNLRNSKIIIHSTFIQSVLTRPVWRVLGVSIVLELCQRLIGLCDARYPHNWIILRHTESEKQKQLRREIKNIWPREKKVPL